MSYWTKWKLSSWPLAMPVYCWTTQDELVYLRDLHRGRKKVLLKRWLMLAYVRWWNGYGMSVEVGRCILEARDLLADLERIDKAEQSGIAR